MSGLNEGLCENWTMACSHINEFLNLYSKIPDIMNMCMKHSGYTILRKTTVFHSKLAIFQCVCVCVCVCVCMCVCVFTCV